MLFQCLGNSATRDKTKHNVIWGNGKCFPYVSCMGFEHDYWKN